MAIHLLDRILTKVAIHLLDRILTKVAIHLLDRILTLIQDLHRRRLLLRDVKIFINIKYLTCWNKRFKPNADYIFLLFDADLSTKVNLSYLSLVGKSPFFWQALFPLREESSEKPPSVSKHKQQPKSS